MRQSSTSSEQPARWIRRVARVAGVRRSVSVVRGYTLVSPKPGAPMLVFLEGRQRCAWTTLVQRVFSVDGEDALYVQTKNSTYALWKPDDAD